MKTFKAYRPNITPDTHNENQRNAPYEVHYEGCVFSDGRVSIRWMTAKRSTSTWDCLEDMLEIHGHAEYGTYIVWGDGLVQAYRGNGVLESIGRE